jgi:hypothetical protein
VSEPAASSPPRQDAPSPAEAVEAAVAALDEADPASHAEVFEAVDAILLAELRRLEAL